MSDPWPKVHWQFDAGRIRRAPGQSGNPEDKIQRLTPADAASVDVRAHIDRFFDLSLDVMGISNAEGRFIQINPAFERMTGYTPDETIGSNCRFLQGPDTDAESVEAFAQAIRDGREVSVELLN